MGTDKDRNSNIHIGTGRVRRGEQEWAGAPGSQG